MKDLAPNKLRLMLPSDYINYCWLQNIEMMQDVQEIFEQEPDHNVYYEVLDDNPGVVADDGPEEELKVGQKVKKPQNLFPKETELPEYRKFKQMKMANTQ